MRVLLPSGGLRISVHCRSDCFSCRDAGGIKIMQAENIDAKIIRCDAFSMKGTNAAGSAEKMLHSMGVELVFGKRIIASQ